jgi:hypothetical protein
MNINKGRLEKELCRSRKEEGKEEKKGKNKGKMKEEMRNEVVWQFACVCLYLQCTIMPPSRKHKFRKC